MSFRAFTPLALIAAVAPLPAQGNDAADLVRVVSEAPALSAAARRVQAATERVGASGQLRDPEMEGMVSRMNGAMGERNDMYEITLRQPLPKRGERAAQRDLARAGVTMAEADYAVMFGEMAAETAMALAEAEASEAKVRALEQQLGRLDAVLRSLEARLSTTTGGMGGARLADRLTVQTRVAAMQLMLEGERRMIADVLAEARARLGLADDQPLPAFAAPMTSEIDAAAAATVRLAAARGTEADAMLKMARANANPMTAVGVRFERERTAMGDDDTIGVAFMSEFPWRSRRVSRAETRAAEADRAAAQADGAAAAHRVNSALARVARAERLAETARRLTGETLGRLQAEYDTFLRLASAGNPTDSTILMTVELLEKVTDTELQVIDAERAARVARAELWRYVPAGRFPLPHR
jgi:outer membrane protein, heavy metal efflux system